MIFYRLLLSTNQPVAAAAPMQATCRKAGARMQPQLPHPHGGNDGILLHECTFAFLCFRDTLVSCTNQVNPVSLSVLCRRRMDIFPVTQKIKRTLVSYDSLTQLAGRHGAKMLCLPRRGLFAVD